LLDQSDYILLHLIFIIPTIQTVSLHWISIVK